jgi:hypothetical protein
MSVLFIHYDDTGLFSYVNPYAAHVRTIEFLFNTKTDTPIGVASEMVEELSLSADDLEVIAREIDKEVCGCLVRRRSQLLISATLCWTLWSDAFVAFIFSIRRVYRKASRQFE